MLQPGLPAWSALQRRQQSAHNAGDAHASAPAQEEEGRLPAPHCEADAAKLLALADRINAAAEEKAEVDEKVLKALAYTAAGELSPMAAFFGGVVGQEVRALLPLRRP